MNTTVNFHGVELQIVGTYDPGEPCELYDQHGEPGTPGAPSSFDIETITIDGSDVTEMFDHYNMTSDIEIEILNKLEND